MSEGSDLPAPIQPVLTYCALGWSWEAGHRQPSGRPMLPDCNTWIPALYRLAHAKDWQETLPMLGAIAMGYDSPSFDPVQFMVRVFQGKDIQRRFLNGLDDRRDAEPGYRFQIPPPRKAVADAVTGSLHPTRPPAQPAKPVSRAMLGPSGFRWPRPRLTFS